MRSALAPPPGMTASGAVRVVRLSVPLRLAVPSLLISSLPRRAIGFSYERGAQGALTGSALLGGSLLAGAMLAPALGPAALAVLVWLVGSTGLVMLVNSATGLAFVKPLCTGCRLLPIIKEHEAMHMGGVESDAEIWDSVRGKYSYEGLSLGTDPAVCGFCPIAKRLKRG
ncbi:MAG TPA: hypothetical protein VLY21_00415 [Nitrososphaerales archaeon]|nr:hypothetical protein [Nitrososphaerales archaeon]HUK74914.1 hypothetical protein [Nitrososphaerales archaeon]